MPCTSNIYIYIFSVLRIQALRCQEFIFGLGLISIEVFWQGQSILTIQNAFLNSSQHHSELFIIKKGENNFSFPLNIQWANTNLKEN